MIWNENFQVLTQDNQNWVLTNVKGNKLVETLPQNYIPVCIETRDGIAYIISAEVQNGVVTGKGQIGTYPSPNYGLSKYLVSEYRPLKNYMGDVMNGQIQDFISKHFKFTLQKAVSMVIEEDYDGTVNIVWTDGVNPMRIVNSRFTARDAGSYEVIDRDGAKDSNLYFPEDWETTINLIAQVDQILKVRFQGVNEGGRLKSGNYRYYFALETQDGNKTDVMGESSLVSVFQGTSPKTIQGGVSLEETEKTVSFLISGIDSSYPFLRVFFVYATGEDEPVEQAYMIDQRFSVVNGQVQISHLGSEQLLSIDKSILNVESHAVDTVGTIAKANDYILAGDITDKVYNYKPLIDFSRKITVAPKTAKIHTYGKTDNGSDLSVPNQQSSEIAVTDGYNNGYLNPSNIYHKLPYASGESYPFGVRFILPGGKLTQTFPVMGMDMVNGESPYPANLDAIIDNLVNLEDGFREADGINLRGVLRFPNKNGVFDGTNLIVNGVKFKVSEIPAAVKKITIGVQFMRAESNQDRITQGVLFNTMAIPADDYVHSARDIRGWAFYDYDPGFTEESSKFIPLYNYRLESPAVWEEFGGGGAGRRNTIADTGIVPIRFSLVSNQIGRDKKFAFVSPEIQAIASKYIGRLSGRDITIKKRARIQSKLDCPSGAYGGNKTYSLIRQTGQTTEMMDHKAKASWVIGGNKGKNGEGYSGGAYFQGKFGGGDDWAVFNLNFNDFLGITLNNTTELLGTPAPGTRLGSVEYNLTGNTESHSLLVDIYPNAGQRTTADLKRVYSNISGLSYFPISERFYWESDDPETSLKSKLVNNEIVLFGGDTFVGPNYRRMYINAWGTFAQDNFRESEGKANLGETMMYFAESRINPGIRAEATYDVSEPYKRSFYPYEAGKKAFVEGDEHGSGNPWRSYRLLETVEYNHGHRLIDFGKFSIAFPVDSPFIATRRRARIMHSGKFTSNSFNNEWRRWEGLNYRDYDNSLGAITRLGMLSDQVVIVQSRGTSFIRLEERIAAGDSSGGPVFFEMAGVLPPKAGFISSMGSSWPESVIFSRMGVYGYDHGSNYIWKYDTKQLTPISKMVINSYLKKFADYHGRRYSPLSPFNVISSINPETEEVVFSFRQMIGSLDQSFSFYYSELVQDFTRIGKHQFFKSFAVSNKMHSVSMNGKMFEHDSDEVPRGFINEQQEKFKVSFVVNSALDLEKVFWMMDIMSNRVFPDKITYRVPGAKTEEVIVSTGEIYRKNAAFIYNKIAVSIPKVQEVTDNDATEYRDSSFANYESVVFEGSRMRGHLMIVDLEYSENKNIAIKAVNTYFNP